MDIVNEKKDVTENDQSEFAAQRSEAISELMDKSTKQNWQKPKKTVRYKLFQVTKLLKLSLKLLKLNIWIFLVD